MTDKDLIENVEEPEESFPVVVEEEELPSALAEVKEPAVVQKKPRTPEGVMLVAIYHFITAFLYLVPAVVIIAIPVPVVWSSVYSHSGRVAGLSSLLTAAGFLLVPVLVNVIAGIGLIKVKNWARWLAVTLAILSLVFVPIGTVLGAFIIYYLLTDKIRETFTS